VQFARSVPALRQHICTAVAERGDIASQSLSDQWQHLVLRPLSKLPEAGPYVVVVDALDECDNEDNVQIIVRLLAEARSLKWVRLRVFLTTRPVVAIRHGFGQITNTEHKDFVLHDISPSIVDYDIKLFLETELQVIGQRWCSRAGWPGAEAVMQLVQSASGLFIWAATACRFIGDGRRFAGRRLETILRNRGNATAAPEEHLDEIYVTVLRNSVSADYTDDEKQEQYRTLKYILGSVVVLLSPLSTLSLSWLLQSADDWVGQALGDLHAILNIPEDPAQLLRLHHPSFRDFLLNKDRCDANFWVDEKQAHQKLLDGCIQLMTTSLKQDICGAGAPGMLAAHMERSLSLELQYACLYWIQHLQKSGAQPSDNDQVHQFLQEHLLHWLEALGWMRKVTEGVHAIASLDLLIQVNIPLVQKQVLR